MSFLKEDTEKISKLSDAQPKNVKSDSNRRSLR